MIEVHEPHLVATGPLTPFPISLVQRNFSPTPCFCSHPAMPIGQYMIFGGNAAKPIVKDANVYVSLHKRSCSGLGREGCGVERCDSATDTSGVGGTAIEIVFPIEDGGIPGDIQGFQRLVSWLCHQLQKDRKVHVGCVGGHGRTGMVLAAIYAQMTGEKDAIQYLREHYCCRAVETKPQVKFLMQHYGVSDVATVTRKNDPAGEVTAPVLLGLPASLAQLGVRVFPVERGGKIPLIKEWTTEASCAATTIAAWDRQYPGCNWALACGPESGVFVLDVDGENGKASMAELCKTNGESWTRTLEVKTDRKSVV